MVLPLRSLATAAALTLRVEKPWLVLRRRALRRSSIGCEEPGGACPPAAALVRLLPAFVCHFLLCRWDAECRRCLGRRALRVQPDRVQSLPLAEKKNLCCTVVNRQYTPYNGRSQRGLPLTRKS